MAEGLQGLVGREQTRCAAPEPAAPRRRLVLRRRMLWFDGVLREHVDRVLLHYRRDLLQRFGRRILPRPRAGRDLLRWSALLASVFAVPFKSPADYSIEGYDTEIIAGARVFTGRIRSRDRVTQLRKDRWKGPAHWWDEMRLLVTDSDPQYFCVQIALGRDDRIANEAP